MQDDFSHLLRECIRPAVRPLSVIADERVSDGFGLHEGLRNNTAVKIKEARYAEGRCLLHEQGLVRNEINSAGICESVSVTSTKLILLHSSDGFGIGLEHELLVGTKPATQATEVHN